MREKINYCIEKNIPIVISECGLTQANGDGELYFQEFSEWVDYLDSKNISWLYWSFSNKDESSAILMPEYGERAVDDKFSNSHFDEENIYSSYDNLEYNYINAYRYLRLIKLNHYLNENLSKAGMFMRNVFLSYN